MLDLIICVYACDTIPQYKDQILKIEETWGAVAHNLRNVKLLYFLGEEIVLKADHFIHLKNVQNDYISASYKQWHSLKYVYEYEKYDAKFIMCCGTDTYVNVIKLLKILSAFDHRHKLYIGGHGCHRLVAGEDIYFHSGGPGFIISKECLNHVYPMIKNIDTFMTFWTNLVKDSYPQLIYACDVGMGYIAHKLDILVIKMLGFYHCNHKGHPCHINQVRYEDIISCHCMSLEDFDEFSEILKK